MGKKSQQKKITKAAPQTQPKAAAQQRTVRKPAKTLWIRIILIASVLIMYGNSVNYDFTVDDNIFYLHHSSVQKGVSGIGEMFTHGSLELEIYKPVEKDRQTPHDRDEVYVVASGNGQFFCNGETAEFNTGDFLFVPAGIEHRFFDFSSNFSAWVIFYGPRGGEKGIK